MSSRSSISVGYIHDPNELAKQNETQRLRDRNCGCQERWGRLGEGTVRESETDVCRLLYLKWITKKNNEVDNQEGPTVPHRERCSVTCGSLRGRGVRGRMATCLCVAESFHCSPETVTSLLIGYTPVQNKKLKKEPQNFGDGFLRLVQPERRGQEVREKAALQGALSCPVGRESWATQAHSQSRPQGRPTASPLPSIPPGGFTLGGTRNPTKTHKRNVL